MPLVARYNVFKLPLYVLGSLGFVVIGAWLTAIPNLEANFWGIVSVIFFGFCGIAATLRFADRREILIIDKSGVFDRRALATTIPWSEIEEIREIKMHRQTLFGLTVSEPTRFFGDSRYLRTLSTLNRSFGADVFVSAHGLNTNKDKLRAALKEGWTSSVPVARVSEPT